MSLGWGQTFRLDSLGLCGYHAKEGSRALGRNPGQTQVWRETDATEARTWGRLSGRQPMARGEQRRIHPRVGVFGRGAGPRG
jgi:hypothetical protein